MTIRTGLVAALLAAASLIAPASASAADGGVPEGPTGVAIVASPEMGAGVCFETTPEAGFACAKAKCEAVAGDQADQCTPVRWCLPARFGADVVINNSEGFTYHDYLCDEDDEAGLAEAVSGICKTAYAEAANGCSVAAAWDLDGKDVVLPDAVSAPAE